MSRWKRQRDELSELCRSGSLIRAIDLAFEHFADFGRDDDIVALLAGAIEHTAAPERVRRRFAELNRDGLLHRDAGRDPTADAGEDLGEAGAGDREAVIAQADDRA